MVNLYNHFRDYIPLKSCIKKRTNYEFLIVMNENTDIFYLNDTARFIYENIDGNNTINDIYLSITREYDMLGMDENKIKKDLIEIIREFQCQKIIKLKEAKYEKI